jgi:D-beta-D-heptose 7-phosphate kinase/D-beta-D-heptose 1-phosphate adenosyltransferase
VSETGARRVDPVAGLGGIDVLVIGDAMLDTYLRGSSDRLCQEAPVPVVSVAGRDDAPGGAANVAANAAALGGRPHLVALGGTDAQGVVLRAALTTAGVDRVTFAAAGERQTLWKERVVADGHLLTRVDRGSAVTPDPREEAAVIRAIRRAWRGCLAVAIADYAYGTLSAPVVEAIGELQANDPRTILVDAKDLARYRAIGVTAAKPNFGQALALLGGASRDQRVAFLAERGDRLLETTGAHIVAVTLDHEGALAFERGRPSYRTYATPVRSATTSGAGDTFAAAMTLALAAGEPMPVAVELASAAASVVVAKEGTATCTGSELRVRVAGDRKRASVDDAVERLEVERRRGRRIVFTNGCFDLLHRGHVTYLSRAKALGDLLVVGVNDDASVRALKGMDRPINPLEDRLEVLAALSCVDLVVPFSDRTPERLIERVRPDVFVKGGDYTIAMLPEAPLVRRLGGEVRILSYVEDRSTTATIERIRHAPAEVA